MICIHLDTNVIFSFNEDIGLPIVNSQVLFTRVLKVIVHSIHSKPLVNSSENFVVLKLIYPTSHSPHANSPKYRHTDANLSKPAALLAFNFLKVILTSFLTIIS